MNPTDPALLAAVAALTQQVTGLGSAVTMMAQKQNQQSQQQKQPGQDRRPGSAPDAAAGGMASEGPLGKVLGLATAKVMAFIAPLVAVGTVLAQTISGFSMITTAVKVLATTLAPLLLPVFVLLAAAIVAVSDELWEGIKNVLPAWYGWIMQHGIPVFVALVGAVRAVIDWFRKLSSGERDYSDPLAGRRAGDPIQREGEFGDDAGGSNLWHRPGDGSPVIGAPVPGMQAGRVREEWKAIQDDVAAQAARLEQARLHHAQGRITQEGVDVAARDLQLAEAQRRQYLRGFDMDPEVARRHLDQGNVPGIRGAAPPKEIDAAEAAGGAGGGVAGAIGADRRPSPAQRFGTAVRDVVQSLRMQIAPPAQMLASNSVNRQAQMDLYKQDPLERRMQERSLAALDMLLQAIPKIESNTAQKPPGLFGG